NGRPCPTVPAMTIVQSGPKLVERRLEPPAYGPRWRPSDGGDSAAIQSLEVAKDHHRAQRFLQRHHLRGYEAMELDTLVCLVHGRAPIGRDLLIVSLSAGAAGIVAATRTGQVP